MRMCRECAGHVKPGTIPVKRIDIIRQKQNYFVIALSRMTEFYQKRVCAYSRGDQQIKTIFKNWKEFYSW